MSENSVLNFGTESFQMSHFQTAPPTAPQKPTAYEDANKIFELINQLNSTIGFETKQTQQQQQSAVKDYETRDSIEPLEMTPNGNNSTTTAASTVPTSKIPRINFLHNKPPPTPAPPTTITTATAPVQQPVNVPTKIPTYQTQAAPTTVNSNPSPAPTPTTPTVGSKLQAPMSLKEILNNGTSSQSTTRLPRSQVRNSIAAASTPPPSAEGDDEEAERAAAASAAAARIRSVTKRGVSLSNVPKMKTTRSMSINDAADSLDDTASQVSSEGKKNIKYVVRHKPRESQVKIFTQKVEIKNVSSKIGSLEKAAHYTPSGGNIKIESHKLAWNAKSRIGSLEYADYRPKGGNVKVITIENFFYNSFTIHIFYKDILLQLYSRDK
jgi:hypothetical protein